MIELKGLWKSFEGRDVLKDINATFENGKTNLIIGQSGSGKTVLMKCIVGLLTPERGELLYDNRNFLAMGKNEKKALRREMGMIFQSAALFDSMTVLDNVLLAPTKVQKRPKAEVQQEAEALLDRVGLLAKKNSYPRELSGGQKQRVAIVRALCMHPEILLFDEVTAALDPEMVREVLDVMLDLAKQGKTMIIVTHEMQFARAIANRVIFLDGGKIVEEAAPAEFFDRPKTERAQRFLRTFTFDAVK